MTVVPRYPFDGSAIWSGGREEVSIHNDDERRVSGCPTSHVGGRGWRELLSVCMFLCYGDRLSLIPNNSDQEHCDRMFQSEEHGRVS